MRNFLPLVVLAYTSSVSAQSSDSSKAYFDKGIAELQSQHYTTAISHFKKAIQFNPQNTQAYIQNGFTYLHISKLADAKASFEKAHALEPQNQSVIKELAPLYLSFRQFDKAIDLAQQCRNCETNDRVLGISYYQQEEYLAAAQNLEAAVKKNPKDAEAIYTLARTYIEMELYPKALNTYKQAVQQADAKASWFYEMGMLQYQMEDYKSAVASFTSAIDKGYSQTNDVKENLGYAYLFTGEYDKGESLLMNLVANRPGNTDIVRDISIILYQQKQYDRSLDYCQKLLEKNSNDARALYQAGLCFQKKGQKSKGQGMCDKAIEMDPSLASLRQKKEIIGH